MITGICIINTSGKDLELRHLPGDKYRSVSKALKIKRETNYKLRDGSIR